MRPLLGYMIMGCAASMAWSCATMALALTYATSADAWPFVLFAVPLTWMLPLLGATIVSWRRGPVSPQH